MLFNQVYQPYLTTVAALTLPASVRGTIVSAATAAAVAATLPISAEPVINPEAHFNQVYALGARQQIGVFNDVAVLNYDLAAALVRKFWLLRYSAVHGTAVAFFEEGKFAECFSGIKLIFSEEELAVLNENATSFGRVRQSVGLVLNQIKNEQAQLAATSPSGVPPMVAY